MPFVENKNISLLFRSNAKYIEGRRFTVCLFFRVTNLRKTLVWNIKFLSAVLHHAQQDLQSF
jgi:hypothetical protein